jgi:aryl-alcohol dehydrogenase-like predicted oxidoreductase
VVGRYALGKIMIGQAMLETPGQSISTIGLGTVNIGGPLDEEAAYRLMDYALERGITFFDTAEEYSSGRSERTIGDWLRRTGCRTDITLCTKVLGGASDIHAALEASLDRLGTDYVDIYLMHEFVPSPPLDEILAALTEEVQAGRVRTIGCSNYTAAQLEQALQISRARGYHRYEVLQPEYNLVMAPVGVDSMFPVGLSELEDQLLPLAERERIAVTTYSPLGSGFLTGKYTRARPLLPGTRFEQMSPSAEHFLTDRNFKILESVQSRAESLGIPVVQLALAWAMTHPSVTSVIIGPRTTEQIDDAIAALRWGLDPDVRAELSAWARSE